MIRALLLALALLGALAGPAWAVRPDEMLKDPALEARAREISKDLRCLVCQNENIDDSNADLAHDIRVLVRDRLKAGDTNAQVKEYLVSRYGQFVLLKPPFSLANAFIWLSGPIAFLAGLGVYVAYLRRRKPRALAHEAPLSAAEQAELDQILKG